MYIKVTISGSENSYFKLDKNELILGRSTDCDMRVPHLDISRKHVKLLVIGNTVYVTDLNATNGITIGDARIAPMKKTKIELNTQVILSKDISFILLEGAQEDDSADEKQDHPEVLDFTTGEDKTVANMDLSSILISLKEAEQASEKVVKEPIDKMRKHKKKKQKISVSTFSSLRPIIVGVFIIFSVFIWKKEQVVGFFLPKSPVAIKLKKIKKEKVENLKKLVTPKVQKIDYSYILDTLTCQTDVESGICKTLGSSRKLAPYEGVVQLNNKTFIVIDAKTASAFYKKNLVYSKEQLPKLANYLVATKKQINLRRFQKRKFIMNNIPYESYNQSYVFLLDFVYSKIGKSLLDGENEDITILLLGVDKKISYSIAPTKKEINWILANTAKLSLYLKYYFISGIAKPIDNYFKSNKKIKL